MCDRSMEEDLTPAWLDVGFVKELMRSVESISGEVSVSRWHCSHAVPPGTNYLSLLYRLTIDYTVEDTQRSTFLIIKTPLESGPVKEFVEKADGYGRELKMYQEVLPKMYELSDIRLTARSYACPLHNSLVLEDLREQGYKMCDRIKQLDGAHCRQFLISLARFHGLTLAVHNKEPDLIKDVGLHWLEECKLEERKFTKFNLAAFWNTIVSMGYEKYAEIIGSKLDNFHETIERMFQPSGELLVLSHGDCWTTNILFKYNDSGEITGVRLVDFQMTRFASFALDIIYFWFTSARSDVREHLQEELFEVYRQTLNETLESVQISQSLTKEAFDNEIRRFSPYALHVACSMLTVAMADPDDLLNFNNTPEEEFKKIPAPDSNVTKNFRSKYFKAVLPDVLRHMERLGTFSS